MTKRRSKNCKVHCLGHLVSNAKYGKAKFKLKTNFNYKCVAILFEYTIIDHNSLLKIIE